MKDIETLPHGELIKEILRTIDGICRRNKDNYPCLYRKNYRTYLPYSGDVEGKVQQMIWDGLITAQLTEKGFENIRLTEKGRELIYPPRTLEGAPDGL